MLANSLSSAQETLCCGDILSPATQPAPNTLRICSDPNNLPFSNLKSEGFENKIAALIAKELNLNLETKFIFQRMGFFREILKAGECELVMAAPTDFEKALTTKPYYRSTYVFLSRKDRALNITSLDDPSLKKVKIGIQLAAGPTPPAQALAKRNIIDNVVGFSVIASEPDAIINAAIAKRQKDIDKILDDYGIPKVTNP
jgi:mxaJ protein